MPTYHYRCSQCGHSFDKFQKFSESTLTECPECTGPIRRVPQPVGIVFKGSGWYINDSRDAKSNNAKAAEKPPKSEGAAPVAADSPASAAKSESAKSPATAAADG